MISFRIVFYILFFVSKLLACHGFEYLSVLIFTLITLKGLF